MPLESNRILHNWIKRHQSDQGTAKMLTDPSEHDLLGFPGIKAEHPKFYLRRLWLPAENDRALYPRFYDTDISEVAILVNRVINDLAKQDERLHAELQGNAFLEVDADRILEGNGYGLRIWGDECGAERRLKSNLEGPRPRWGAMTESGMYMENDEKEIKLTFRHWIAARLQVKINAPCKDKAFPTKTKPSRQAQSAHIQERCASKLSLAYTPSLFHQERPSVPMTEAEPGAKSNSSGPCARSNDSEESRPFTGLESSPPQSSSKRKNVDTIRSGNVKRGARSLQPRDAVYDVSHTLVCKRDKCECRPSIEATRAHNASDSAPPTEIASVSSTVKMSDVTDSTTQHVHRDVNDGETSSGVDENKKKLWVFLSCLLSRSELDYESVLCGVIPAARELYKQSPHRQPHDDWYIDFRNFSRALDLWENLMVELTREASTKQPPLEDPFPEFASQSTFKGRMLVFRKSRSRLKPQFTYDTWTIILAVFFEGLLAEVDMPFPFKDMVVRLRAINEPLSGFFSVTDDLNSEESGSLESRQPTVNPNRDQSTLSV